MPVRSLSFCSSDAMYWRAFALAVLRWSISSEKPVRITFPSPTVPDGSGSMAASTSAINSGHGTRPLSSLDSPLPSDSIHFLSSGTTSSPAFRASNSRGFTELATTRPMMRSRSGTPFREVVTASRVSPSRKKTVHRIQSPLKDAKVEKGLPEPATKEPGSHHRIGAVNGCQHRELPLFTSAALEQLEVPPSPGV